MPRMAMLLLVAVLASLGAPAMVRAHARVSETAPAATSVDARSAGVAGRIPSVDAPGGEGVLGAALVIAAGLLASRARRRGRLLGVALALVVTLAGVERAVHSVHHLGEPRAAERCLVASSGAHAHAIDAESPRVAGAIARVLGAVLAAPVPLCRAAVLAPRSGRAPPA